MVSPGHSTPNRKEVMRVMKSSPAPKPTEWSISTKLSMEEKILDKEGLHG